MHLWEKQGHTQGTEQMTAGREIVASQRDDKRSGLHFDIRSQTFLLSALLSSQAGS